MSPISRCERISAEVSAVGTWFHSAEVRLTSIRSPRLGSSPREARGRDPSPYAEPDVREGSPIAARIEVEDVWIHNWYCKVLRMR
jgi:cellulase/cellobiase CelA1